MRRLTIEYVREKFKERGYVLLSREYKGCGIKLEYKCMFGHINRITWNSFKQGCGCSVCDRIRRSKRMSGTNSPFWGKTPSEKTKKKMSESQKKRFKNPAERKKISERNKKRFKDPKERKRHGESQKKRFKDPVEREKTSDGVKKWYKNNPDAIKSNKLWKGGYAKKGIPVFDTFAQQLDFCEKVRRDLKDKNIIQVKCTYCGKWYVPSLVSVKSRLDALKGRGGENRLYCSEECKSECPIYNQNKYPKDFNKPFSVEVDPELRQMVFERDEWACLICNSSTSLHCHHVDPKTQNQIFANDMDSCATYCKICHKWVHSQIGCRYWELRCNKYN